MTKDLITIKTANFKEEEVQAVDAKELYSFLEVQTRFNDWISRQIKEYGFVENQDYISSSSQSEERGRPSIEYTISIDMAKELAMVERNEKGRQARQYFIQAEKKLKEVGRKVTEIQALEAKIMDMKKSILESIQVNTNTVFWDNGFPTKYALSKKAVILLPRLGKLIREINDLVESGETKSEVLRRMLVFITDEEKATVEKSEIFDSIDGEESPDVQEINKELYTLLKRKYELLGESGKAARIQAYLASGSILYALPSNTKPKKK